MKTFLVNYKYDNEIYVFVITTNDEQQIEFLRQCHDNNTHLDPILEDFILKFPQLYENNIVYQSDRNLPMPIIDKHIDYLVVMGQ